MSGEDVIRLTVEIDREKFYADLSEGGYDSLGRVAAWNLVRQASYEMQTEAGRDYGMRIVPEQRRDASMGKGDQQLGVGPFTAFCIGVIAASVVIAVGANL